MNQSCFWIFKDIHDKIQFLNLNIVISLIRTAYYKILNHQNPHFLLAQFSLAP